MSDDDDDRSRSYTSSDDGGYTQPSTAPSSPASVPLYSPDSAAPVPSPREAAGQPDAAPLSPLPDAAIAADPETPLSPAEAAEERCVRTMSSTVLTLPPSTDGDEPPRAAVTTTTAAVALPTTASSGGGGGGGSSGGPPSRRRVAACLRRLLARESPLIRSSPVRLCAAEARLLRRERARDDRRNRAREAQMQAALLRDAEGDGETPAAEAPRRRRRLQTSGEASAAGERCPHELAAAMSALNAGFKTKPKARCLEDHGFVPEVKKPWGKNAAGFGASDRGDVQWPGLPSQSPGPAYNIRTSWAAGTTKLRPPLQLRALAYLPGPGDYSVEKADSIVRTKPVEGCFISTSRMAAGYSRLPLMPTASSHLSSCMPLSGSKKRPTKQSVVSRCVHHIEDATADDLRAGIGRGDAYSLVPHTTDVDDADAQVMSEWEAKCQEEDTSFVVSNPDLASPVKGPSRSSANLAPLQVAIGIVH
eukprot:Rhum_TRINITY_DN10107_c0_g1::Rhum_TRINITY_DN10107_c0_g1_i1::g.36833::m.36833